MGLFSSKSKTTSKNPEWLDRAGGDVYNFARSAFFKPTAPAQVSRPSTNQGGRQHPFGLGWKNVPYSQLPQSMQRQAGAMGYGGSVPTGAQVVPETPGPMSLDNLREFQVYQSPDPLEHNVAQINEWHHRAADIAGRGTDYIGDMYNRGQNYVRQGTQRFSRDYDPNMVSTSRYIDNVDAYISPYIRGAIDPVAERLREEAQRERLRQEGRAVSRGAFGGSRQAIEDMMLQGNLMDSVNELYGRGYADAYRIGADIFRTDEDRRLMTELENRNALERNFESTRDQFNREQNRFMAGATTMGNLGRAVTAAEQARFDQRMQIGELNRKLRQARYDQRRRDFEQQRDYPLRVLQALSGVISGSPAAGSLQTTQQPSIGSQLLGAGVSLGSAALMGPAAGAAGAGSGKLMVGGAF